MEARSTFSSEGRKAFRTSGLRYSVHNEQFFDMIDSAVRVRGR